MLLEYTSQAIVTESMLVNAALLMFSSLVASSPVLIASKSFTNTVSKSSTNSVSKSSTVVSDLTEKAHQWGDRLEDMGSGKHGLSASPDSSPLSHLLVVSGIGDRSQESWTTLSLSHFVLSLLLVLPMLSLKMAR